MIEKEMRVGPKGQVVIPRPMRKALKIEPGSKVLFRLEDDKLILKKPAFDAVAVFKRIAKEANYNKEIDPHAYEEELDERYKRALSGANVSEEKKQQKPQR
jgi:AbrB family looped-hinge helix DNA binding protein